MSSADSPAHPIPETKLVLIFDLDGTLIRCNSFYSWVLYMLFGTFGGLDWRERLMFFFRTVEVAAKRKLKCISHFTLKQSLQALWRDAVINDPQHVALRNLCRLLQRRTRLNLCLARDIIVQAGDRAVLATAAASVYAGFFGRTLGFRHVLATEPSGKENYAEEKRDRVLAFLSQKGLHSHTRIFLTDHREDLPLICESQHVLWFGSDSELPYVRNAAPGVEIIACRDKSAEAIRELLLPAARHFPAYAE